MTTLVVDLIFIVLYLGIPGAMAFSGVRLMAARSPLAIGAGVLVLIFAGLIPIEFAYAWSIGTAGAVIGGTAAALRYGRRVRWPRRVLWAAAVVLLIAEPVVVLTASSIQADETYSRCAADKAVGVVEKSRADGHGYPPTMHDVAMADGEYGDTPCYVSNGVNWLYRVSVPGDYTLGYWVDWHVTRHVCLHAARTQGWTCGFELWGPFRPGEVD